MKKIIIGIIVVLLVGVGIYWLNGGFSSGVKVVNNQGEVSNQTQTTEPSGETNPTATTTIEQGDKTKTIIGQSVQGRDLVAYHYGTGDTDLLFIGGVHGGYEWNTALVAYRLMDYLAQNSTLIPAGVRVTVIPVLNPDGLYRVTGKEGIFTAAEVATATETQVAGRFNANQVDLNRNFDCDWQASGKWQNRTVSGGSEAFSEPETKALRDYIKADPPAAVVVWYSAAGGIFASSCHNGVSTETNALTQTYAKASGYPAYQEFDFYAITGDLVNWLAKEKIPATSVLLSNHTDTEWTKNRAGIEAVLNSYAD